MTLVQACPYEPPHVHEYPDDWQFGGPSGTDPRLDPRFIPNVYIYFDSQLKVIHITSAYICHDEAIDNFTAVAGYGPGYNPKWIQVKYPDKSTETLKVIYHPETDEVEETA